MDTETFETNAWPLLCGRPSAGEAQLQLSRQALSTREIVAPPQGLAEGVYVLTGDGGDRVRLVPHEGTAHSNG